MKEFNLSEIPPALNEAAIRAIESKDAFGLFMIVGHEQRGRLLGDNVTALKERGMYEKALADTYTHGPHLEPWHWRMFFTLADRERLRKESDIPIPNEPLLVYRGVSSTRRRKWIRGLSWTKNKNTAAWFATRWATDGHEPAVYALKVKAEEILFATNGRSEEELVVAAWDCGRLRRLDPFPDPIRPE